MMVLDFLFNMIVIILIGLGIFFFFTATLGLLRFPDFYCRLQATGKGDTLGAILILTGIALYNLKADFSFSSILVSLKVILINIFIFYANPTATHAITKAGMDADVSPLTKEDLKR